MILIHQATIINEGESKQGSVLIHNHTIQKIYYGNNVPTDIVQQAEVIDAKGLWLIPGAIDDQVHFREPGLTHKADIASESRSAVAGGITSFMDMPNTNPQTTTTEALSQKFEIAAATSLANYSFYFGATNENTNLIKKIDPKHVCGIKVFMGASTGNMLVDNKDTLSKIFSETDMLIATHCEKEEIIRENIHKFTQKLGSNIPVEYHPLIRSAEACYQSSAEAVELAHKYNARLHILHISTAKELSLFERSTPLPNKRITAEACVHHLWFTDQDYPTLQTRIKWNPAVKTLTDRDALRQALIEGTIDVVATDHAPHLWSEKQGGALQAASGGPLVQHALPAMLSLSQKGIFSKELVIEKMCHAPATIFNIDRRGFIKEGYYADLVLINPNKHTNVTQENILSKCGWSPFEGESFGVSVEKTFVNGKLVYNNGIINEEVRGEALEFLR